MITVRPYWWSKSIPSEILPRPTHKKTAPRPLLQAYVTLDCMLGGYTVLYVSRARLVSAASGVSTKINLYFQTSSKTPYN